MVPVEGLVTRRLHEVRDSRYQSFLKGNAAHHHHQQQQRDDDDVEQLDMVSRFRTLDQLEARGAGRWKLRC